MISDTLSAHQLVSAAMLAHDPAGSALETRIRASHRAQLLVQFNDEVRPRLAGGSLFRFTWSETRASIDDDAVRLVTELKWEAVEVEKRIVVPDAELPGRLASTLAAFVHAHERGDSLPFRMVQDARTALQAAHDAGLFRWGEAVRRERLTETRR